MAEKKNFTIENYNGTDYDTLYPETNSGQVLLDSNAQTTLNLESGKTLDDAFNAMSAGDVSYKIGDTLTTARTGLGDKWLLCNGAFILASEYQELSNILSTSHFYFAQSGNGTTTALINSKASFASDRGETENFLVSLNGTDSSYSAKTALYATNDINNPDGWTDMSSVLKSSFANCRIKYVNGVWFILTTGKYNIDVATMSNFYCNGSIYDTSNYKVPNAMNRIQYDVVFYDNKYYFLGKVKAGESSGDSTQVLIYSNLDAAPTILEAGKYYGDMTVVPDGVLFCSKVSTTSKDTTVTFTLIKSDGTTQNYIFNRVEQDSSVISYSNRIFYFNKKYYWFTQEKTKSYILVSDKLENFEQKYAGTNIDINGTVQTDDYLIISNGYYIDKTSDIPKEFDNYNVSGVASDIVVGEKNYYYVDTKSDDSSILVYSSPINTFSVLPSVSLANNLYTYIKAKS